MSFEPFKSGNPVEYLVGAVFQGQGYLVRRSVPLRMSSSGRDITDVDLLGIKFTRPYQLHRIICDCKDRQKSRPYERIFWAKGLSSFVDATETYVALPKASWDFVNYARTGQIRVLTQQVLEEDYQRIYGEKGSAHGIVDQVYYEPFYRRLETESRKDAKAGEVLFRSRSLFLTADPYISLNVCLEDLQFAADTLRRSVNRCEPRFELWRYIAADLVVAASFLLICITADTLGLSKPGRDRHILDRLTYGDISPVKAREIFGLAKELALQATTASSSEGAGSVRAYDIGDIDAPTYATDVCGLVERAIRSPELYHGLPQVLDFLLFEQAVQDKGFSEEQYRHAFPGSHQQERLKVARNLLSFVRDACGLDLEVFWPKENGHVPRVSDPQTGQMSATAESG